MMTGLLALLLVISTSGAAHAAGAAAGHDGKPTYEDFVRSVAGAWPYTASAARRARILGGYERVAPRMSKGEIAAAIGEPDYSQLTGPKTEPRPRGSMWVYILGKRSELVNMRDPVVEIFFDDGDRATRIVPRNVDG